MEVKGASIRNFQRKQKYKNLALRMWLDLSLIVRFLFQ